MPAIVPRLYFDNQAILTATIVTSSSEQDAFPDLRIRDPRRSKTWRSEIGWNIVVGVNDVLDFTEATSGAAQAVLTEGNFANGADMAAEITTQMNAVATDNTYLCTYDVPLRLVWRQGNDRGVMACGHGEPYRCSRCRECYQCRHEVVTGHWPGIEKGWKCPDGFRKPAWCDRGQFASLAKKLNWRKVKWESLNAGHST